MLFANLIMIFRMYIGTYHIQLHWPWLSNKENRFKWWKNTYETMRNFMNLVYTRNDQRTDEISLVLYAIILLQRIFIFANFFSLTFTLIIFDFLFIANKHRYEYVASRKRPLFWLSRASDTSTLGNSDVLTTSLLV